MAGLSRTEINDALLFDHMKGISPFHTASTPYVFTYQFEGYFQPADAIWNYTDWTPYTEAEKDEVRRALALYETYLNVDFVEVTGSPDPDISFGKATSDGTWAGIAGNYFDGSQLDAQVMFDRTFDLASAYGAFAVILHELGHALGLDHSFDDTGAPKVPTEFENSHYTIMSYTVDPFWGQDPDTLMFFDVVALQYIWGAAENNAGNTTYTGSRTATTDTVWDSGGTDIFDASAKFSRVKLDLREGHYSRFDTSMDDVAIAFATIIENAAGGSGNDKVVGNAYGNTLWGGAGDDFLNGKQGNDILRGEAGNDRIRAGNGEDYIVGGAGDDIMWGGVGPNKTGDGAADTFVYSSGTDWVKAFENDLDSVQVVGRGTVSEILALGQDVDGNAQFDFGNGDVLIVRDMSVADLSDRDLFV